MKFQMEVYFVLNVGKRFRRKITKTMITISWLLKEKKDLLAGYTFETQLLNEADEYVQNKQYTEAISDIDKAILVLGKSEDLVNLKKQWSYVKI